MTALCILLINNYLIASQYVVYNDTMMILRILVVALAEAQHNLYASVKK